MLILSRIHVDHRSSVGDGVVALPRNSCHALLTDTTCHLLLLVIYKAHMSIFDGNSSLVTMYILNKTDMV